MSVQTAIRPDTRMSVARRLLPPVRRRWWGDAVWFVVAAARHTAPVLAATRTLVPGEALSSADLRVVDVALGQLGDAYVTPTTLEPGSVATRTIAQGELVPISAVGDATRATTTTIAAISTTAAAMAAVSWDASRKAPKAPSRICASTSVGTPMFAACASSPPISTPG